MQAIYIFKGEPHHSTCALWYGSFFCVNHSYVRIAQNMSFAKFCYADFRKTNILLNSVIICAYAFWIVCACPGHLPLRRGATHAFARARTATARKVFASVCFRKHGTHHTALKRRVISCRKLSVATQKCV